MSDAGWCEHMRLIRDGCPDCDKQSAELFKVQEDFKNKIQALADKLEPPPTAAAREGDGPYKAEGITLYFDGAFLGNFSSEGAAAAQSIALNAAFHAGAKEQREKDAEIARGHKHQRASGEPCEKPDCWCEERIARAIQQGGKP